MKTIFKIAASELRSLFYSPIAWFLLIVYFIQCGVGFMETVELIAREQENGARYPMSMIGFLFGGSRGVFSTVMGSLYLYLPLLTMGLISREKNNGTIRLLYSSPIDVHEIVLGKFLAMVAFSAILVGIVGLYVATAHIMVINPDTAMLLSGLLGLFLLVCTYSAIGLFMSGLTNYQIVAAVCTFVTIWVLGYVGKMWQDIDFVRNLTYFLSISGRTNKMLAGLITSKDLIYFMVIIFMFLSFSILRLKADMEIKPVIVKVGRYLAVLVVALAIGYVSSIPKLVGYADVTVDKSNTITPAAQKIIQELGDEPLEVTAYCNLLGPFWYMGAPGSENSNLGRWEPYMRFKHNMTLNTVLFYDTVYNDGGMLARRYPNRSLEEMAKQAANSMDLNLKKFKTPAEIRQLVDRTGEGEGYLMQLTYKNKKTFLRVFDDNRQWPSESEVAAAFKRLVQDSMPRITFVTGHYERDIHKMGDRQYKALTNLVSFRYSLVNQGFDVDTVALETQEIPQGISVLVLADPRSSLTPVALEKIQQYIQRGGNLLISGEPGKQANLNPLLQTLNVQLLDGMIVQQSKDLQPELAAPLLTEAAAGIYKALEHAHHDSAKVSMPSAAALSFKEGGDFAIQPLLLTDPRRSWLKKQPLVSDSAEVQFDSVAGDERKAFPLALKLTRKINDREQRIVVLGDADFMGNSELSRPNLRTANFVFNTGLFSWLSDGEFPVDSSRPGAEDTRITLSKTQAKTWRIIYLYVIPGILVGLGALLLIRRKRK
ncbi:MAG: Gldg family protein [Candidatus Pseudobacter hemicellulosilyticus]|uniref:Gldg family protein n=1 Tax=Candidatus Pseudobacter hemicellulosilyticus TaxID=3121375 RepID=A0AAJ6BJZ5_9BACT|nr:MAG: Gldg family protein [Pseudobacter sp.]